MSGDTEQERNEIESQEAVEARVRKVRHLDPFTVTCHADGRFVARLDTPPDQLNAEVARSVLEKMEAALEGVRDAAEQVE